MAFQGRDATVPERETRFEMTCKSPYHLARGFIKVADGLPSIYNTQRGQCDDNADERLGSTNITLSSAPSSDSAWSAPHAPPCLPPSPRHSAPSLAISIISESIRHLGRPSIRSHHTIPDKTSPVRDHALDPGPSCLNADRAEHSLVHHAPHCLTLTNRPFP